MVVGGGWSVCDPRAQAGPHHAQLGCLATALGSSRMEKMLWIGLQMSVSTQRADRHGRPSEHVWFPSRLGPPPFPSKLATPCGGCVPFARVGDCARRFLEGDKRASVQCWLLYFSPRVSSPFGQLGAHATTRPRSHSVQAAGLAEVDTRGEGDTSRGTGGPWIFPVRPPRTRGFRAGGTTAGETASE